VLQIPFIDLQAQRQRLGPSLESAINRVLSRGDFIQGEEVGILEQKLATFCESTYAITCANGTDALTLIALAEELKTDDAIFVPAFTFVASAEAFAILGITPYFVDVHPDTYNIDPSSLITGIEDAKSLGLNPKMVIAVDLFGQPASYSELNQIAQDNQMIVVADAAQSFGASQNNRRTGTLADYTTTSFFPAKPLGCYGDGGAIFTDNEEKANLLKSLNFHGKGSEKYDNVRIGMNSRLDTVQAAILLEKLAIYEDELAARKKIAERYTNAIEAHVETPVLSQGTISSWALYTIKTKNRDSLKSRLQSAGIPSAIYYPKPLNQQTGYLDYPVVPGGVPVSERLSQKVLSLPMHPYLDTAAQDKIIEMILASL
jgi:dTDP-4-amino-4,6-dideoxygalactose transaminase